MMNGRSGWRVLAMVVAVALAAAACGGDDDEAGSSAGAVGVTVQEWGVIPDADSTDAGDVTITVTNKGEETHEFVVVKTDLDVLDLPTADDGSLDEEGEGVEAVDEIEDISPASSRELTVDLEPGNYVFLCNIVEEEDGETVSHFANGMRAAFTVN